jgi:hypothetical protein
MDNQNCLNGNLGKLESTLHNLTGLKESVESLHTQVGWNADYIKDPRDKLEQAGHDLQTAETKIETLARLSRAPWKALVHSGCDSHPGTGSLHPVAIGAVVEETKLLKPPV